MSNITDRHTVNLTGRLVDRIDSEIGNRRGVVVFGFYFTLVLAILSIALLFVRSFSNLETAWIFSIGVDVFCLLVCTMLYLSCLLAKERGYALEITNVQFASLTPGVYSGKYNIASSCIAITDERKQSVLFSDTTYIE